MKWLLTLAFVAGSSLCAADDKPRTYRFGKDSLGKVPAGWKVDKTGKGEGSVWQVVADDTAPSKSGYVLAQIAEGPSPLFNLCVAEETRYRDLDLRVSFKSVKGVIDQGGGLVWRYQDANNYYIARYNPKESNFRVYKVVAGKREQLQNKSGLKLPEGAWHTLRIKQVGDHIECYLDGTKHLDVKDTTFTQAGQVGLWTKADAHTHFDDLVIQNLDK